MLSQRLTAPHLQHQAPGAPEVGAWALLLTLILTSVLCLGQTALYLRPQFALL